MNELSHGSYLSYLTGWTLSLVLTLIPGFLIWLHAHNHHSFPTHHELFIAFIFCAIAQLLVQLIFFLHFGLEKLPGREIVFAFTLFIVIAVVGGSLWIMQNLQSGDLSQEFIDGVVSPETQTN